MVAVLRFRLFNMPVTVRGSFLLIAALIGFTGVGNVSTTVAWIAIVFVSILIHELGHAFTARTFGSDVAIELNGLGGLTRWSVAENELTPGRRALIAAAGSGLGLLFGGIVWAVASLFGPYQPLTAFILDNLVFVNVVWGLVNWLPIRPLDGGHLLETLLERVAPARAELIARIVFMTTAAAGLAFAIWQGLIFIALLAGWMLLSEFSVGRPPGERTVGLPALSYDDPPADEPAAPPRIDSLGESRPPDEPEEPDHN
jgi:Zn-dependent protease